jgi:hypothetical protein
MSYYKTPTHLGTKTPSPDSRSVQRKVDTIRQSNYYVALREAVKILNIKIPKHTKLTAIKQQCCNIKSIKSKLFQL